MPGQGSEQGLERELWADVTPDIMSDEEQEQDEETFTCHPPSYRSGALNKFIAKLDAHLDSLPSSHPRGTR